MVFIAQYRILHKTTRKANKLKKKRPISCTTKIVGKRRVGTKNARFVTSLPGPNWSCLLEISASTYTVGQDTDLLCGKLYVKI